MIITLISRVFIYSFNSLNNDNTLYGNFKSIKLQETFNIDVHSSQYNTTMYATCTTDYTETFNVSGAGTVKITRPSL